MASPVDFRAATEKNFNMDMNTTAPVKPTFTKHYNTWICDQDTEYDIAER